MNDNLVTFETAKLAKEKGFSWKVSLHYESNGNRFFDKVECNFNNVGLIYSAPTQSLLQKWLREKHKIHIEILLSSDIPYDEYYFRIMRVGQYFTLSHDDIYRHSYEEILEIALFEALKLIKNDTTGT